MQDREEIISGEVTGRGPNKDQTRPISCSATTGISSSDRTLSEVVTRRTDFTVHRRGNNSVRTGRTKCSVRSCPERFQSGANTTGRVRSMMTGLGSASDLYARAQRLGQPDASGQDDSSVRSLAESWVSPPTATFSVGLINRPPPTSHLIRVELRKHTKGVDTPF